MKQGPGEMLRKLNRFTDFMSRLLTQYKNILEHTSRNYPFRVVAERVLPKTGETIFTIQFIGKRVCPKLSASELADDDELIQGFSPKDVKRIMQATLARPTLTLLDGGLNKDETHRIVAKNFVHGTATYTIELENENHEMTTKTLSVKDFAKRKDFHKFSKQDIYDIAYTVGANSVLNEQDGLNHAKKFAD